jgi:hypothetical protein
MPATLELNRWQDRVWVKVHPLREGARAAELARESRDTASADVARAIQAARAGEIADGNSQVPRSQERWSYSARAA